MKKAFTLIELIVVIAIIVLLVGIFLPALAHCRCFCLSNYTQTGQSIAVLAGLLILVLTVSGMVVSTTYKARSWFGLVGLVTIIVFIIAWVKYGNGVDAYVSRLKGTREYQIQNLQEHNKALSEENEKLRLAIPAEK